MRYNKFRRGFEVNSRDVTLQNILQNHAGHSTGPGQAQQGSETALSPLVPAAKDNTPERDVSMPQQYASRTDLVPATH